VPIEETLQTIALDDGTEVEIHALTPEEASQVRSDFFTWDEATVRRVAAIAIVKPPGIFERQLTKPERDKIYRATGNAWLQGWIRSKSAGSSAPAPKQHREGKESQAISPSFTAEKLEGDGDTIENRIDVYEDRIRGWLLRWAEYLNSVNVDDRRHAGFAVLSLSLAYFEAFAIFLRGRDAPRGKSSEFFRAGILEIFPELKNDDHRDAILEILWKDGRNGLFHHGIALQRIRLRDDLERAFRFETDADGGRVFVCRHSLVWRLLGHLERYVGRLRSPGEVALRNNFLTAWDFLHRK
jgi:hypothetical protein